MAMQFTGDGEVDLRVLTMAVYQCPAFQGMDLDQALKCSAAVVEQLLQMACNDTNNMPEMAATLLEACSRMALYADGQELI